jgi:outer membrane protein
MTRTLLVVVVSLLAPLRLAAQDRAITLTDALKLAQRTQPGVIQAQGQVETSAAQRRSAWGAFLPSLTAGSSASVFFSEGASRIVPVTGQVLTGNTTNGSLKASLRASVDLFTGFRRGADLKAARAGQAEAEAGWVDARYAQDLATTNQFFDALSTAQLVGVRQASVRRAEEQLKVSVAKLHAGSATRSDSLRSLVTLGSAQLDLIQAQTDLATAEAGLGRLVGETGRVRALDDSSFHHLAATPDTASLRQEAETKSPRVQTAVAGANVASANLSASRAAYWPSLTLGANTSWNGSRANDYTFFNQRQLSLSLSWDIFNGFDRELTIAQRRASLDVAEATAADERRAVDAALTQYLAQLESARTTIDITATSVAAATEDLRVQQERYRLGASTIVDVLTSQEALNQAEVDVVNARFNYLRAKAQLEALIGRTL